MIHFVLLRRDIGVVSRALRGRGGSCLCYMVTMT